MARPRARRPVAATLAISRRPPDRGAAAVGGRRPAAGGRGRRRSARASRRRSRRRARSSNGAVTTPSSVTIPVISSAGVTSNDGLRTSVPGGAIATPRITEDLVGAVAPRSRSPSPSGVAEVDRARRGADEERDRRGAPRGRRAGTSRPCSRCRRWPRPDRRRRGRRRPRRGSSGEPAATSGISVCGTPAWASSQAVSRAPWRYGRVSSTQT